jgi:hypothetical protein
MITNALNLRLQTWLTAENDANVNIKGKLHSADGANINSKAHSNIDTCIPPWICQETEK